MFFKEQRFFKDKGSLKSTYFSLSNERGEEMELLQPFSNIFPLSGFAWYITLNGIDLIFGVDF